MNRLSRGLKSGLSGNRLISTSAVFALMMSLAACGGASGSAPCPTCTTGSVGHFIVTANAADSTVSALTSDKTAGTLASVTGSPYAAGSGAWALAASAAAGHIYVANILSGDISAFTLDSKSGRLSAIAGSPFPAEVGVDSLAIDPGGKFLYAVSQNSANLWTFSIGTSGGLAVSGNPVVFTGWGGTASSSVVIDPTGKYLYVTASRSGTANLYQFSRDSTTGTATPLSSLPSYGQFIYGLANKSAFDPAGKMLLVTGTQVSGTTGGVQVSILDSLMGSVLLAVGSPTLTGVDPAGSVVATGNYVYVPNTADATISAFSLDSVTGCLTAIPGSPFPSGGNGSINGPLGIATDTSGHFVFVCNASNDISVFAINSTTGALSPIAGSPFPAGGHGPSAIAFLP